MKFFKKKIKLFFESNEFLNFYLIFFDTFFTIKLKFNFNMNQFYFYKKINDQLSLSITTTTTQTLVSNNYFSIFQLFMLLFSLYKKSKPKTTRKTARQQKVRKEKKVISKAKKPGVLKNLRSFSNFFKINFPL